MNADPTAGAPSLAKPQSAIVIKSSTIDPTMTPRAMSCPPKATVA